jgi:hypothetical protein
MGPAFTTCFFITVFSFSVAIAGPIYPDPQVNQPSNNEKPEHLQSTVPLEPMGVTNPPPIRPPTDSFFYKWEKSISFNTGPYSLIAPDGTIPLYGMFGFTYLWQSSTRNHIETGADAITTPEGHLWAAYRVNFDSTDRFRTFTSVGPGVRIVPPNGLATFLALSHYFARGAAGLEYSVTNQASLRGEAFFAIDLQGAVFFGTTAGVSIGF